MRIVQLLADSSVETKIGSVETKNKIRAARKLGARRGESVVNALMLELAYVE